MIADSHVHTSFSTDSDTPMEAQVRAALSKGMKDICFTDHYDMDYPGGEFELDTEGYLMEIESMRKRFGDRIRIRAGVEIGLKPDLGKKISDYLRKWPFDYAIGSLHLIDNVDPYYRDSFPGTDEEMYRLYFKRMLECLQKTEGYRSVGHLDYIVRYGYTREKNYSYKAFQDVIDPVLEEMVKRDLALEVNTAGFKYGLPFPNPHPDIIRRFRELGGRRITLGSDAHEPKYVGYCFEQTADLVQECGFEAVSVFCGREEELVGLG
ncbi:MAG: histidinol-phosphatase HisJ family protein [Eubacterium sp.]|nr:histidinol-phosphatase HisJ family protein [Eubacterium sp.]